MDGEMVVILGGFNGVYNLRWFKACKLSGLISFAVVIFVSAGIYVFSSVSLTLP